MRESFTAHQKRLVLMQLAQGQALIARQLAGEISDLTKEAQHEAVRGVVSSVKHLEKAYTGADVVLPVTSGLEMDGVYMRRDDRAIRWQDAAVPRVGESKPDWEIWIELAHTLAKLDAKNKPAYWAEAFPPEWKDYRKLWSTFVALTPGMKGMSAERMAKRAEPLRWPCPSESHPGVSTLYVDHPSWYVAAEALGQKGKRFLTPSGKCEFYSERLAAMGIDPLPTFTPPVSKARSSSNFIPSCTRG